MPDNLPLLLLQPQRQPFYDGQGRPLVGGKVWTYSPGTTIPKATYADPAGAVANPNPLPLDGFGQALMYGSGSYDVALYDRLGALVYTVPQVSVPGTALDAATARDQAQAAAASLLLYSVPAAVAALNAAKPARLAAGSYAIDTMVVSGVDLNFQGQGANATLINGTTAGTAQAAKVIVNWTGRPAGTQSPATNQRVSPGDFAVVGLGKFSYQLGLSISAASFLDARPIAVRGCAIGVELSGVLSSAFQSLDIEQCGLGIHIGNSPDYLANALRFPSLRLRNCDQALNYDSGGSNVTVDGGSTEGCAKGHTWLFGGYNSYRGLTLRDHYFENVGTGGGPEVRILAVSPGAVTSIIEGCGFNRAPDPTPAQAQAGTPTQSSAAISVECTNPAGTNIVVLQGNAFDQLNAGSTRYLTPVVRGGGFPDRCIVVDAGGNKGLHTSTIPLYSAFGRSRVAYTAPAQTVTGLAGAATDLRNFYLFSVERTVVNDVTDTQSKRGRLRVLLEGNNANNVPSFSTWEWDVMLGAFVGQPIFMLVGTPRVLWQGGVNPLGMDLALGTLDNPASHATSSVFGVRVASGAASTVSVAHSLELDGADLSPLYGMQVYCSTQAPFADASASSNQTFAALPVYDDHTQDISTVGGLSASGRTIATGTPAQAVAALDAALQAAGFLKS